MAENIATNQNELDAEIRRLKKELASLNRKKMTGCTHNHPERGIYVEDIHASQRFKDSPNVTKTYPDGTMICSGPHGCGAIFCADTYTPEEVQGLQFQMYSMIQQLKMLIVIDEETKDILCDADEFLAAGLPNLCAYYNKFVDTLAKGGKNKNKNNNGTNKGGIGVPAAYNSRR